MKLRKAIRKMVALGTGLSMVGATLLGATAAADLKSYPTPFIKDGVFNGIIVFGDTAAASDVAGAVDLATTLQYQARVETPIESTSGTSVSISGDAAQIREGSDILEIGESLYNVTQVIGKDDLKALAAGSIQNSQGNFKYNQYIKFNDTAQQYVDFAIDDDDAEDIPADYLFMKSGHDVYQYEMEFQEPLETEITDSSGNAATSGTKLYDLEDESLVIMGKTYAITTAKRSGANQTKLTLMGGDVADTLEEGQTKTYTINGKDYEVTALIIDDTTSTPSVKLKINGEVTRKLLEDQTDTLSDGMEIGIRSILGNEAGDVTQDLVEFFLGIDKVIITDTDIIRTGGGSLEVNEETVSDASVEITGSDDNTKQKISKIKIRLAADDDLYVAEGKGVAAQLDKPEGFFTKNFDIEFQGLSTPETTEVKLANAGDKQYYLTFTNRDGTVYKFPLVSIISSGLNRIGDDSANRNLIYAENMTGSGLTAGSYIVGDEDTFILNDNKASGTRQTGYTHLLQYKGQDATNNVLTFKELGTGETIEVAYTTIGDNSDASIIIGGKEFKVWLQADAKDSNITVDLTGDGVLTPGKAPYLVTKSGVYMNMTTNGSFVTQTTGNLFNLTLYTDSDDLDDASEEEVLVLPITVTSTPQLDIGTIDHYAIDMSATTPARTTQLKGYFQTFLSGMHKVGSTDNRKERTNFGILVDQVVDTNGPDEVVLTVPSTEAEALVYVTVDSPAITKTQTEGGALVSSQVTPIALGTAKLASEVTDIKAQNAIVVGGPCVNTHAATLLGNPSECTKGFTEGKAIVKLVEQTNGNVAMLVAGYSALDTRRAARVVADGTKLKDLAAGVTEIEVAGTTLTEATVSVPVAVAAPTTTTTETTTTTTTTTTE